MKQFITPDQLLALSTTQKANLMDLWLPQVNTLAMARICKDVINDEYDNIVFVIGEVLVTEARRPPVWSSLRHAGTGGYGLTAFLRHQTPEEIVETLRANHIRYAVVDDTHIYDDTVQPEQNGYPQSFVEKLKTAPGLQLVEGQWPGMAVYRVTDPPPQTTDGADS